MKTLIAVVVGTCFALAASVSTAEAQTVANDEFGFSVSFPPARRICIALSGDHPHGFYAWYGARGCARSDQASFEPFLAVYASFNSLEDASPVEALPESCAKGSPGTHVTQYDLMMLTRGKDDLAVCAEDKADGSTEIMVALQSEDWTQEGYPQIDYTLSLGTRPERLSQDLPRFRAFLDSLKLRKPG